MPRLDFDLIKLKLSSDRYNLKACFRDTAQRRQRRRRRHDQNPYLQPKSPQDLRNQLQPNRLPLPSREGERPQPNRLLAHLPENRYKYLCLDDVLTFFFARKCLQETTRRSRPSTRPHRQPGRRPTIPLTSRPIWPDSPTRTTETSRSWAGSRASSPPWGTNTARTITYP